MRSGSTHAAEATGVTSGPRGGTGSAPVSVPSLRAHLQLQNHCAPAETGHLLQPPPELTSSSPAGTRWHGCGSPATHLSHWVLAATLGGCVHFVGKQSKTQRAGQLPWARTAESGGARTVTRLTAAWALPWPGARSPLVWPSLLAAVGE